MISKVTSEQVQQWSDEINQDLASGHAEAAVQKTQLLVQKLKTAPNHQELGIEIQQAEAALAKLKLSVDGQTPTQSYQQQAGCLGSVGMFLLLYGGQQVWTVYEARNALRGTDLEDGGIMYSNMQSSGFLYVGIGFLVLLLAGFASGGTQTKASKVEPQKPTFPV
ncbi:MAG: hypothetical protein U0931_13705 [Vulcanimicrobiota bacterium]